MRKACIVILFHLIFLPLVGQTPLDRFRFHRLEVPKDAFFTVSDILQDSLGFLWFGTSSGLIRFDGNEFTFFRPDKNDSTSISDNWPRDLSLSPDNDLWIATSSGLNRYDHRLNEFSHYRHHQQDSNSLREDVVRNVLCDSRGRVWIGYETMGLSRLDPATGRFHHYPPGPEGGSLIGEDISSLFEDSKGRIWVGSEANGLSCLLPGADRFTRYAPWDTMPDGSTISSDKIREVTESPDGKILIGTSGGGLCVFDPEKRSFSAYRHTPDDPATLSSDEAYSVMADPDGTIWVGTWSRGLNRISGRSIQRTLHDDELPYSLADNVVRKIFRDRNGVLWIGTQYHGLCWADPRHEAFRWHFKDPVEGRGLSDNHVRDVLEISDDELWVGTYSGGINIFDRGRGTVSYLTFDPSNPYALQKRGIWSMHRDKKGRIWVTSSAGLSLYLPGRKGLKTYRKDFDNPDGLSNQNVLCVAEDARGRLWLGTWGGGLNVFDPETEKFSRFMHDPADTTTIAGNSVLAVCVARDGRIWTGTNAGISVLDPATSRFTHYTTDHWEDKGLIDDKLAAIIEDREGRIWLGSNSGLIVYEQGSFRWLDQGTDRAGVFATNLEMDRAGNLWAASADGLFRIDPATGQVTLYHQAEGIISSDFAQWASHAGPGGRLYFGTQAGLLEFDPADLPPRSGYPPLILTDFLLFNRSVKPSQSPVLDRNVTLLPHLTLRHTDAVVTFEFSAMDHQLGERVRYGYRLRGFNQDWIETDHTDRRATFTNIPPGEYTFQVRVQVDGGKWSEPGIEIGLTSLPPWWQTWWARSLYVLVILLIVVAVFWIRTRSLRRQKRQLEITVRERTAEIREQNLVLQEQKEIISREKAESERLLLNILPQKIAEELKQEGQSRAQLIGEVTVLFTDFKGFTGISQRISPEELVAMLNECFSAFDRIMERHGVEKIKTIGDAYMAAGGLPIPNSTHARDVISAALEIQSFMAAFIARRQATGEQHFEVRIGIHSGPVVAGIVGLNKFQYDVWGDTVNTASRMESSGQVGRINISEATYQLVKDLPGLRFEHRGKVQAKGKGEMEMYFVDGSRVGA